MTEHEVKIIKALIKKQLKAVNLMERNESIVKTFAFNAGLDKALSCIDDFNNQVYSNDVLDRIGETHG